MLWPRYNLILLEGFKLKDDKKMFLINDVFNI